MTNTRIPTILQPSHAMPTPPIHPRSLAPADASPKPSLPELLTSARLGESWRLRVDFGAAYAALIGRKVRGRAPSMVVEVVMRIESLTTHGNADTNEGGVILRGPSCWRSNAAPRSFRVPSELRCPFAPTPKFPPSLMVGNEGDVGGAYDGSWIIGQFGTIVGAERVEVNA